MKTRCWIEISSDGGKSWSAQNTEGDLRSLQAMASAKYDSGLWVRVIEEYYKEENGE